MSIYVMKARSSGHNVRYRYRILGNDLTIKDLEESPRLTFRYSGNMNADDIAKVERRWKHKLNRS